MALIERIRPKPQPEPRKPVWIQRMERMGLTPKDTTGKVAL